MNQGIDMLACDVVRVRGRSSLSMHRRHLHICALLTYAMRGQESFTMWGQRHDLQCCFHVLEPPR